MLCRNTPQHHTSSADKGYAGESNQDFLLFKKISDGIMRKDSFTAKIIEYEKSDVSMSHTSESVNSSREQIKQGILPSLKTILIAGSGEPTIVSRRG